MSFLKHWSKTIFWLPNHTVYSCTYKIYNCPKLQKSLFGCFRIFPMDLLEIMNDQVIRNRQCYCWKRWTALGKRSPPECNFYYESFFEWMRGTCQRHQYKSIAELLLFIWIVSVTQCNVLEKTAAADGTTFGKQPVDNIYIRTGKYNTKTVQTL